MAYPQRLLTEDETIVREFHPHWRVLLGAGAWAVVGLALAIAGLVWGGDTTWLRWGGPIAGLVVILGLTLPPVLQWRFKQYVLTTERIIVRDGIISRGGHEIPLENINDVSFSQNVFERLLGYGDVMVESAGSQGQSRLTDIPDPEAFQSQVYRVREDRSIALHGSGHAPTGAAANDPMAQLQVLADLHERGALSDAEFEEKKRKLLDQI